MGKMLPSGSHVRTPAWEARAWAQSSCGRKMGPRGLSDLTTHLLKFLFVCLSTKEKQKWVCDLPNILKLIRELNRTHNACHKERNSATLCLFYISLQRVRSIHIGQLIVIFYYICTFCELQ